jgi:hypothetical protein
VLPPLITGASMERLAKWTCPVLGLTVNTKPCPESEATVMNFGTAVVVESQLLAKDQVLSRELDARAQTDPEQLKNIAHHPEHGPSHNRMRSYGRRDSRGRSAGCFDAGGIFADHRRMVGGRRLSDPHLSRLRIRTESGCCAEEGGAES